MTLTERQQLAQALADQLHKLGVRCTSPLPLEETKNLLFDVLNDERDAIISKLASWGWHPKPCNSSMRFVRQGMGHVPAASTIFELALPPSRPPAGTRSHNGFELADAAEKARTNLQAQQTPRLQSYAPAQQL